MSTFKELGLSDKLLKSIEILGFSQPTRIQKDSIPLILSGKDIIGESETGSGKTLAFGCGIIEKCSREGGIQALVLTPTRELAEQVKDSMKELVHKPRLNVLAIYGGTSINAQIKHLTRANVVVATPGRLLDHLERGTINLSNVKILVMDEADRMFDMGFIDDVKKIIKRCPRERQTLFFSATISPDVKKLANRHMVEPETILAGNIVDPAKLKQTIIRVSKNQKFSLLTHFLKQEDEPLAMVFCNTRHLSDFVDKNLRFNGIKAAAIHGGLTQNARLKAIDRFHNHEVDVLVCTDVAARGLHIKNVSHVINYDLPPDPNDYIHRIGRTARAGESGQVINILTNFDKNLMKKIQWQNKAFKVENMEVNDFKEAKITTTMGRIKQDHSARPGSGQKWDNRDGGYRNSQEKHRSWKSSSSGQNENWKSNSKPGSYKKNSDGFKGNSGGYKGKSDDRNSKPGGYKGKSDGYKGKSSGNNGKSGGYRGKSDDRNSKPSGYIGNSGGYKGKSSGNSDEPKKDWRAGKNRDGGKDKFGNYKKRSSGKPNGNSKPNSYKSKSGGNSNGPNKDWRSDKNKRGNKSKSGGHQGGYQGQNIIN